MEENFDQWKQIAQSFYAALPVIDDVLSEQNVPMSDRKAEAFRSICDTMIEVDDWKAFLASDVHGRFLLIIEEWYNGRYGKAALESSDRYFLAAVTIHKSPFELRVPRNFSMHDGLPNTVWIGFPASVQKEEEPLKWIENQDVVSGLDQNDRKRLQEAVTATSNDIRSIAYDLRALEYIEDPDVADLAAAVGTDLEACARHLCDAREAALRASGWDMSQAVEKALKIFIRRKGEVPPFSHDLAKLAAEAERLGSPAIDRAKLAEIPSKSNATGLRYGGRVRMVAAISTYTTGLPIVRDLLLGSIADIQLQARELRINLRRPPWFDFDIETFLAALRASQR